MSDSGSKDKEIHWSKTRNLTFVVLAIWLLFSLILPAMAKSLNEFSFLGFKLGYYIIVQGSLIVFVLLIWIQNMQQDKIDDAYGTGE